MDYLGLEERNATIGHDFTLDPARRPMDRALGRADVVAMNLQRRIFKKWRQEDFVKSINVYSDASPVVGAELQGTIIDVNLKDGTTVRVFGIWFCKFHQQECGVATRVVASWRPHSGGCALAML